jgi:hypothetical protein
MTRNKKIPSVFTRKDAESLTRKYETWQMLRDLKKEYTKEYTGYYEPSTTGYSDSFDKWLQDKCGIKIHFNTHGDIMGHVDIIDEAKYAWMLLKYK